MRKFALHAQDILNKEFKIDFKGYNAEEVDRYMDIILGDYYTMEDHEQANLEKIKSLEKEINELKAKLKEEQVKNEMIESQYRKLEDRGINNIDVLKRISRLEELLEKNQGQ